MKKIIMMALMTVAAWSPARAATIQLTVGGYFGGNKLQDLTTILPDNTLVDLGIFYRSSAFTSTAAIQSALSAVTTDSQMQSFLSNNGWVSFGTGVVSGGAGDFTLSWQPNDAATGPGFGTPFNIDPSIGSLVGKNGYVWVKTPSGTPVATEYGLFQSNTPFQAAGFGVDMSIDMVDTGDSTTGVTALFGSVTDLGIATKAIPEPTSTSLILVALSLVPLTRRKI